jgi:hypothetical protein
VPDHSRTVASLELPQVSAPNVAKRTASSTPATITSAMKTPSSEPNLKLYSTSTARHATSAAIVQPMPARTPTSSAGAR